MGPGCPEHKKIPDVVQNIATEILRFLSKKYKGGKIDFFGNSAIFQSRGPLKGLHNRTT